MTPLKRLTGKATSFKEKALRRMWRTPDPSLPWWRRTPWLVARFIHIWVHQSIFNRLVVHAAALTLTTLLSLLPLVAVILVGVKASGLITVERVQQTLSARLPELRPLTERGFSYVEGTDFASLGIAGIIFLGGAVLSMFSKVERALNEVWGVPQRNIGKRVLEYGRLIGLIGMIFALVWGLQIISTDLVSQYVPWLSLITDNIAYRFVTLLIMSLGFGVLFRYMPNTRVPLGTSLIAGAVCAVGYALLSAAYFGLQIGVANYNMLYSSLAALPITVIWIDITWVLILVMGQFSAILPYFRQYSLASLDDVEMGGWFEETVLLMAIHLAERHNRSLDPPPVEPGWLARAVGRPLPLVNRLLDRFVSEGLLIRIPRVGYRFARPDWRTLRLQEILDLLRHDVSQNGRCSHPQAVSAYLTHVYGLLRADAANLTLDEAVQRWFAVQPDRTR